MKVLTKIENMRIGVFVCVCVCFQLYAVKLRDLACGNLITRILEGKRTSALITSLLCVCVCVCALVLATY